MLLAQRLRGVLDEMQLGAMFFSGLLNRKSFVTELGELDKAPGAHRA